MDADIVKIATMAHSIEDASRVLAVAAQAKVPTIAIAMGELGFFTRILGAKYGAPFTYAGFNPERTFAPGMPWFHDLKRDYFYDRSTTKTEVYAVVGDPIAPEPEPGDPQRGVPRPRPEQGAGADPDPLGPAQAVARRAGLARHQGVQRHDPAQGGRSSRS